MERSADFGEPLPSLGCEQLARRGLDQLARFFALRCLVLGALLCGEGVALHDRTWRAPRPGADIGG